MINKEALKAACMAYDSPKFTISALEKATEAYENAKPYFAHDPNEVSMDDRGAFEAWFDAPHTLERNGESYKFMTAHRDWQVWQAATAYARAAIKPESEQDAVEMVGRAIQCLFMECESNGEKVTIEATARAAIAAMRYQKPVSSVFDKIPDGWRFYTADFSIYGYGGAVLERDKKGKEFWLSLPENIRDEVPLYISGRGETIEQAILAAVSAIKQKQVDV